MVPTSSKFIRTHLRRSNETQLEGDTRQITGMALAEADKLIAG